MENAVLTRGLDEVEVSIVQERNTAMRRVIEGNAVGLRVEGAGVLDPMRCSRLTDRARFVLDCSGVLLDQRRTDGLVRHCHGDLHLRNIVLLDGQPTLFDAIEFNDDISSIEVW